MTRPYFYLGDHRGMTTLATGEIFFVDTASIDLSPWVLFAGAWETFVDDILCALIKPGDTFVDVGANMGYYTVKLGTKVGPQGRVYSFEPNPFLHRLAADSFHINGYDGRGSVMMAAAGAESSTDILTFARAHPGGGVVALPTDWALPNTEKIEVKIVRIDDVIPADRCVDVIKIDVEGYEPRVFEGMRQVMARSPNAAVVTEVNYHHWARAGDPPTILREFAGGRRIFQINLDGGIEELQPEKLGAAINNNFVSYVLLLPDTPERWAQVGRFADRIEGLAGITPEGLTAPPAAAPAKRSLMTRIRGRLARMIAP